MTVCARRSSRGSVFGRGFDSPRLHQSRISWFARGAGFFYSPSRFTDSVLRCRLPYIGLKFQRKGSNLRTDYARKNGGRSPHFYPFAMCSWYRAGASLSLRNVCAMPIYGEEKEGQRLRHRDTCPWSGRPGPYPAPGDIGVFRERGRTAGVCRAECAKGKESDKTGIARGGNI